MVWKRTKMKHGSWPLLALAFGALIITIGISGTALYRHLGTIYGEVTVIQQESRESDRALNELRSEMYSLAILVRDYLLDSSPSATAEQREELLALRASTGRHLDELNRVVSSGHTPSLQSYSRPPQ